MRLILLCCLTLMLVLPGQAQERVRNVRVRVADSSQLEIRYDLVTVRPGDSVYLEVRSRLRGSLRILPEFVRGDVGKRVVVGSDRRIVWNALANGYSLNEEIRATVLLKAGLPGAAQPPRPADPVAVTQPQPVVERATPNPVTKPEQPEPVIVTPVPVAATPAPVEGRPADAPVPAVQPRPRPAEPVAATPSATVTPTRPQPTAPDTVASRKKRYAGPAWALLSAVAPGFGNIFVQTPKPRIGLRPLLAVGCYGLLAYGLRERQKSRDVYDVYLQQKNAETGNPFYETANGHYHRYFLATRAAVAVAAADVILTFFKGLRNVRTTAANRPLKSVMLRPGLQAGQLTAVARYSF